MAAVCLSRPVSTVEAVASAETLLCKYKPCCISADARPYTADRRRPAELQTSGISLRCMVLLLLLDGSIPKACFPPCLPAPY
jgi:hypothetical protein